MQGVSLENFDVPQGDGKLYVKIRLLTGKYVPPHLLERDGPGFTGKEIRWRHAKLEEEPELFLGETVVTEYEPTIEGKKAKDELWAILAVGGDTEEQKTAQTTIRKLQEEGKKLGVSPGLLLLKNDKGEFVKMVPREVSLTPIPVCEECRIEQVLNEKRVLTVPARETEINTLKVKTMSENAEPAIEAPAPAAAAVEESVEVMKDKVDELEAQLDVLTEEAAKAEEVVAEEPAAEPAPVEAEVPAAVEEPTEPGAEPEQVAEKIEEVAEAVQETAQEVAQAAEEVAEAVEEIKPEEMEKKIPFFVALEKESVDYKPLKRLTSRELSYVLKIIKHFKSTPKKAAVHKSPALVSASKTVSSKQFDLSNVTKEEIRRDPKKFLEAYKLLKWRI